MIVKHTVLPGKVIAEIEAKPRETIAGFVRRNGWAERKGKSFHFRLPTICIVNGHPVLQEQWFKTRIRRGDEVVFHSKPLGGGSGGAKRNSIMGLVAIIGLSLLAPGIAGALLPEALASASFLGVTGKSLLASGLPVGGELLQIKMKSGNSSFLANTGG